MGRRLPAVPRPVLDKPTDQTRGFMRILVFLHDAFGGRGGIAKFNRDLLSALASHPATEEVVCLPRVIVEDEGVLPAKLDFRRAAARGNAAYMASMARVLASPGWFDLVICGHLRLMRLMRPLEWRRAAPFGLILHGVDAWEPFGGAEAARALARLDWFLAVSDFTKRRFCDWSGVPADKGLVVPNAVDLAHFTPGPKRPDLVQRYNLAGKSVLMGMGRLDARERYKGFDEVIEMMAAVRDSRPDLAYLICGDGSDRPRLEAKAKQLGIGDAVIFTGYVPEEDKVDHYRLADCFLLAGWGEGFGIVLIEAMACGIPAIASNLDASSEAVGDGKFGLVVNPRDRQQLFAAVEQALARPKTVPAGLETFSAASFERRIHELILDPLAARRGSSAS
jgi:phosphatidylinositol alpha-1,6-mannosyltransferase